MLSDLRTPRPAPVCYSLTLAASDGEKRGVARCSDRSVSAGSGFPRFGFSQVRVLPGSGSGARAQTRETCYLTIVRYATS